MITTGAQPGDGTAVYTFRDNGSNTALTFTISAGGVAGLYCDNTHTVSVAAGHLIDFSVTNNTYCKQRDDLSVVGRLSLMSTPQTQFDISGAPECKLEC